VYDLEGDFLRSFVMGAESRPGKVNHSAVSISLDRVGNLLIGDEINGVVVLTPFGKLVTHSAPTAKKMATSARWLVCWATRPDLCGSVMLTTDECRLSRTDCRLIYTYVKLSAEY
jgi:hypothetical protein